MSSIARSRRYGWLAWLLFAVVLAMAVSGIALTALTPPHAVRARAAQPSWIDYLIPVEAVLFAAVGTIIVRRRSNAIGWILCVVAVTDLISDEWSSRYAAFGAFVHPLPGTAWALWLDAWVWIPNFAVLLVVLPLVFPNGRLPSPWWRWLPAVTGVLVAVLTVPTMLSPDFVPYASVHLQNPIGGGLAVFRKSALEAVFFAFPAISACGVVAAASLVVRYRHSDSDERHQLKWIAVSYTLVAAGLVVSLLPFVLQNVTGNRSVIGYLPQVFLAATPIAIGFAVFKYHLYDIDVVISRALVYGSLAVLITGVYVGIAVGIGELVGSGGKPNLGLSILATAIVAVGFQPARERLQRVANRLVYGKRATPYQVLSEFSSHVAGSYAADEVLPRMARVLQEGTGAEAATVWLRSGNAMHGSAIWPQAATMDGEVSLPANGHLPAIPGVTQAVEVRHQGELLDALSVVKRRGESLTPVEEKLLDDLAHQAGLVLKNVGLTADLQRRLEELRASRQRLVSAQDAERRKLERNLHDGAQQHLVALKVKLGLAEMLAARDPESTKATLQQLKADADEALDTLRDLARGIYPPLLAEQGLVTALESQARKATVPVAVDAEDIGRYPQEAEATVYFCVLEALQNVHKYACASHATVRLRCTDGVLLFEVEDDGRGFDVEHVRKGAGLTNMMDRLDAVGGTLGLRSTPGAGACVRGEVFAAVAVST